MALILQWNCNGYINNYDQLQLLLKCYNPKAICLQETHLHSLNNIPIPINFTFIHKNTSNNSHGGVGILIHNSIQNEEVNLNNDFESVGVIIHSKQKLRLISTYIAPNKNFELRNLENMYGNPNENTIIAGDFNSWHQSWGSPNNNRKGCTIFKYISQSNLITLNDGSPTHFSTHHTMTHVDLTIITPNLATQTKWKTDHELFGSDHFPIHINLFDNENSSKS